MTEIINRNNREYVDRLTGKKQDTKPIYASRTPVLTDMDSFPYPRYFRGDYKSGEPIVMEREAGWRKREDNCYKVVLHEPIEHGEYPNHCFQTAPSTVYPCYPDYLRKYADKEEMEIQINKACISQYR